MQYNTGYSNRTISKMIEQNLFSFGSFPLEFFYFLVGSVCVFEERFGDTLIAFVYFEMSAKEMISLFC